VQFKLVSKRVRDVSDATATKAYVQNEREKRKKMQLYICSSGIT